MRKISNLLKVKGRVYLLSCTREDDRGLRVQAAAENISIEGSTDLYILKRNGVLKAVGFIDHLCFYSGTPWMGDGTPILRIDVGKYLSGENDYFYKNPHELKA
ncbi:MAG: hypothetical protein MSH11_03010 [Ruminococcus sp.]|nr:hypothetical protein [Ruminococcus sp.]